MGKRVNTLLRHGDGGETMNTVLPALNSNVIFKYIEPDNVIFKYIEPSNVISKYIEPGNVIVKYLQYYKVRGVLTVAKYIDLKSQVGLRFFSTIRIEQSKQATKWWHWEKI
jgi:hypothetical protein